MNETKVSNTELLEKPKMGRPLKFNSAQEILDIAKVYFDKCVDNHLPITITGLCMCLDTTRDVLIDYESGKHDDIDDFSHTIKKCKLVCENYAETIAITKGHSGSIFILKNYGWKDTQTVENIETKRLIIIRNGDKTQEMAGRVHIQPEEVPCNVVSMGDRKEFVVNLAGNAIQRASAE